MDPGQQIGEYIIEAPLGGGGMAKVYRCRHAVLETLHAVKVLDAAYRANAEARQRFLTEAKIQAKHLQHPNIVRVTNIVATADAAALVMDLVDGGSLEEHLTRRRRPMGTDDFLAIALPVLDALAHAHDAGIIHRDIKPANVLLAHRGDRMIPVLADFGIAKVTDPSVSKKSTHHAARMGTLGYMAPEQVRKAKDVTARSDIFSLGAMFYEMVTGRSPFVTDEHDSDFDVMEKIVHGRYEPIERHADPGLDPRIVAAIRRAMSTDPAARFADCRAFAAALTSGPAAKASGFAVPVAAGASGVAVPIAAGAPRAPRQVGLVALLAVVGAAALGVGVLLATRGSHTAASGARDAGLVARADPGVAIDAAVAAPPIDAPPAPPVDARIAELTAPPPDAALAPPPIAPVVREPPPPDRDRDGIPDARDRCPRQPGKASAKGCPDGDGDGIADGADKCPRMFDGSGDGDGCPGNDADGDGIPNRKDDCPDKPETKNLYNDLDGCPDKRP